MALRDVFKRVPPREDSKVQALEGMVSDLQHAVELFQSESIKTKTYVGNSYRSYEAQVLETSRKYEGRASWGNQLTKTIVDLRSAFTIGAGVKAVAAEGAKGDAKPELEFIRGFMRENGLDAETPQDWAREGEIEGRVLIGLSSAPITEDTAQEGSPDAILKSANREARLIRARFISWTHNGYTVHSAPDDYATLKKVVYKPGAGPEASNSQAPQKAVTLGPTEFVLAKFGGRTHNISQTPTRVGMVLSLIEAIDKALRDWREINHLYASPTPYFEAEEKAAGDSVYTKLKAINWRIGRFLVLAKAKFSLVSPDLSGGTDSLKEEILKAASQVSAAVALPIHYFGFPEQMSNRSTADSLMEVVLAGTQKERIIWGGAYTELFRKAILFHNRVNKKTLDPDAVRAEIGEITQVQLHTLKDVWLALYTEQAISRETLLEKIPGIDVDAELKRLESEAEANPVATPLPSLFGNPGNGGAGNAQNS